MTPSRTFESLNATGRPLTETEKLKNWLLMGLPDLEQTAPARGPVESDGRSTGRPGLDEAD